MKYSVLLAALLAFSLTACGKKEEAVVEPAPAPEVAAPAPMAPAEEAMPAEGEGMAPEGMPAEGEAAPADAPAPAYGN